MATISMFLTKPLIYNTLFLSLISDRVAVKPEQGRRQLVFLQ